MRHSSKKKLMRYSIIVIVAIAAIFMATSIFAIPPGAARETIGTTYTATLHSGDSESKTFLVAPNEPYEEILWVEYSYTGSANMEHNVGGLTSAIMYGGTEIGYVRSNHPEGSGNIGVDSGLIMITFLANEGAAQAVNTVTFTVDAVVYYPVEESTTTTTTATTTPTTITTTTIPGQTTTTIPGSGEELDPGIVLFFVIIGVVCVGAVIYILKFYK